MKVKLQFLVAPIACLLFHGSAELRLADDSVSVQELAVMGDLKRLKPLIDAYSQDKQHYIPVSHILHCAASLGYVDIIKYIAQTKPPILADHCTPENDYNITKRDYYKSMTFTAAQKGHLNVVQYIVEEEPSLLEERYGYSEQTIANVAASNGHQDILLYLLDKKPASLVEPDKNGENALTSAAYNNILNAKILKILEARGLFVRTAAVTGDGESLCNIAARTDNLDVVKYFVEQDSSYLSMTNGASQGNIAHSAVSSGRQSVFWYVLEKDPTLLMKKDKEGNYPLLLAIRKNFINATTLETLVQKYHIPLGETNHKGKTVAHMAAICNNLVLIASIVEKEPSILKMKDNYGNTVAGIAAMAGHWGIVQYLANKNSSVYIEMTYNKWSRRRKSIFYMCVEKNLLDEDTFQWLVEKEKVTLNLRETVQNRSIAYLAIKYKKPWIFEYAIEHELPLLYHRVNGSTGPTIAHLAILKGYLTHHREIISAAVESIPSIFTEKDDSNNGNSVLHAAIEQGLIDIEMLEKLLSGKHVSLSEINEKGDTLAHAAAAAPDLSYYSMYLSKAFSAASKKTLSGNAVNVGKIPVAEADQSHVIMYIATKRASLLAQKNNDGDTPAHVAAQKGHVNALRVIAKASSPSVLWTADRRKNSVLHLLASTAKPSLHHFEMLIKKGVPIMGINWEGETAAHIAARTGLFEVVEFMIQKEPSVVKKKNLAGRTIAFTAAENAHYHIIRLVTDKDLLLERDYIGNTMFHLIMESNSWHESDFYGTFQSIDVPIDLLVKPNNYGVSAVNLAAQVGCVWIIEQIAAQNPSILIAPDRNGDSAFSNAVRYQTASIVQIILAKNPKLETQQILVLFQFPNERKLLNIIQQMENNNGRMSEWNQTHFDGIAIHSAIEFGHWRILKHLIEVRKVDVNQPNARGEPPMFTAARFRHVDMLRYLIEQQGADLLETDDGGNNILFVAAENDDLSTIKYVLEERKAPIDVNSRNKVGDSILHVAMRDSVRRGEDRRDREDDGVPVGGRPDRVAPCTKNQQTSDQDKHVLLTDIALYLIEEKYANVNLPGQQNRTVFAYAAERRRYDICAYLRAHGADESTIADSPLAAAT